MMPPDARRSIWRSSTRVSAWAGRSGKILAGAKTSPNSWSSRSLRSVMKTSVGLLIRGSRMILAA